MTVGKSARPWMLTLLVTFKVAAMLIAFVIANTMLLSPGAAFAWKMTAANDPGPDMPDCVTVK